MSGMLWFDSSKKPLCEKVAQAATHFDKKYGRMPELALVNPADLEKEKAVQNDAGEATSSITVRPWKPILPNHLWIGMEATLEVTVEEGDGLA